MRTVFIASSLTYPGGIARVISEEPGVEPVAVFYDFGLRARGRGRVQRAGNLSRHRKLYYHARLATCLPDLYIQALTRRIGLLWFDPYRKLWRGNPAQYPLLTEYALQSSLPFVRVQNVNSESTAAQLREFRPDLLVCLGTRILKPAILQIPRLGALNQHSSLLPNFRGSATEFWQLVSGEARTGVTIHWMSEHVDQGNIVAQDEWPLDHTKNHVELRTDAQLRSIQTWRKAIRAIREGKPAVEQALSRTPTFRRPTLEQLYDFYVRKRGTIQRSRTVE